MKTTFLAIGLLGAALATTAVFADDANTSSTAPTNPAMSDQQVQAPSDTNAAPAVSAPQSGNGQITQ